MKPHPIALRNFLRYIALALFATLLVPAPSFAQGTGDVRVFADKTRTGILAYYLVNTGVNTVYVTYSIQNTYSTKPERLEATIPAGEKVLVGDSKNQTKPTILSQRITEKLP